MAAFCWVSGIEDKRYRERKAEKDGGKKKTHAAVLWGFV